MAAAISDAGVNIAAATCVGTGYRAEIHILVKHAEAARHALATSHDVTITREREVVVVDVEDRPGVLADLTRKVAQAVGASEARIAKADEVEGATGFTPGAVAPFPLPKVETIYLDRLLLGHPIVWAGAGSENHLVGLAPTELARLARAQTMDVVQADPYHFRGRIGGDEAEPKER